MANKEINDFTNKVTPLATDEVVLQATAGGTTQKATIANVAKGMTHTDIGTPGDGSDHTFIDQSVVSGAAPVFAVTNMTGSAAGIDSSATAHAAADGSSHTFIDQDVTSGAAPTFAATNFTGIAGKQTIFVPASAMTPTVSNGCAALAKVETTAGRPDMVVLDFDATADEHAQFQVAFPKSWNESTVTFQAFWTTSGAVTTGVAIGLQAVGMADNETIDVAYGTAVVVTDDAQSAAEELYVTAESSAVTIAGTPAAGDMTFFRVFRDVSDANDDMTQDMRLIGIKLFFTTDALNDA
jgi:hypothetical protein